MVSAPATVLIVEDDPDLRRLIVRLLEHDGFSVRAAADGREALDALEPMPDVIVADLMMPDLDGEQFLVELRSRFPEARPAIVLVSASAIREQVADRLEVDASLSKPFDTAELRDVVRELATREG
ncbi:MAG: response regulator transcription factor [Sandaracinus sp.]|nr:response regulator transcription factor [Sandaracinus sp.]MCB9613855.1 response regulator transcription factor [Sandaracinus sp.]MCB9623178.1 response regulator transcription factor [Sandaracinus sp.]MCB9636387.1 response regulator transcription factor [Sandaracinus sp.]